MRRPEYVLFDCDGVLVDSEPLTNQVIRDDLADRGLDLSLEQVMALFLGGTIASDMAKARAMGALLPDDWVQRIDAKAYAVLAERCEQIPRVSTVLDRLDSAAIGYAVASNGPIAKMDVTLNRTALIGRFTGRIFSASDCAASKPAPDVYLKAAVEAGIAPARCAVVEDSASGARAGKAAGMQVFGFASHTPAEKLSPHCHRVFTDMDQLPGLLGL